VPVRGFGAAAQHARAAGRCRFAGQRGPMSRLRVGNDGGRQAGADAAASRGPPPSIWKSRTRRHWWPG